MGGRKRGQRDIENGKKTKANKFMKLVNIKGNTQVKLAIN